MLMEVAPIKSSGTLNKQREHESRRTDWDKKGFIWSGEEMRGLQEANVIKIYTSMKL